MRTHETDNAAVGGDPAHWLLFRLGHLGDVTLTTGPLAYLAQKKGWTFSVMTNAAFADIFAGNPYVSRVIAVQPGELTTAGFGALAFRTAQEFRGCGLLDLHGSLRSRLLGACWRGPVLRYPKKSLQRRFFLCSRGLLFKRSLCSCTVTQRYVMAAEPVAPAASCLVPRVWLTEEERAGALTLLSQSLAPAHSGSQDRGLGPVALHPYATHALKTWPPEQWQRLARLLDEQDIPWIALGRGASIFPQHRGDLSNRTSLRETLALLSHCRCLVTGDSGPMHLAAAVGAPVLALFGPTTREWGFFPQGPYDKVLETDLPCRPCSLHGKKPCPRSGLCLAALSPESVLPLIPRRQGQEAGAASAP